MIDSTEDGTTNSCLPPVYRNVCWYGGLLPVTFAIATGAVLRFRCIAPAAPIGGCDPPQLESIAAATQLLSA